MQNSKPTPKFTSFRPKVQETPREVSEDQGHRHRDKNHEVQSSSIRSRHHEKAEQSQRKDRGLSPPKNFVIDKRGDPDNLRYGYIHRYSLPRYGRAGLGNIVGLPNSEKIDRRQSTEKQIAFVTRDQGIDISSRQHRSLLSKSKSSSLDELRVLPAVADFAGDLQESYLPLDPSRHRRRRNSSSSSRQSSSDSLSDDSRKFDHLQNAIDKGKPSTTTDSDDHEASRIKLSQRVDREPENGQAWLDLIHHPDFQPARVISQTPAERRASAEIRFSMYEKALKLVKGSAVEALTKGLMKNATVIWDSYRLARKWKEVIHKYPNSAALWIEYLGFLQTNGSQFRFDDVKTLFTECVEISPKIGSPQLLAYIILRYTLFLRQAGFSEQAFAIWQALLEFNFRRPDLAETDIHKSFENFWDSEVPRIGEKNSFGWAKYHESNGKVPEARLLQLDLPPKAMSSSEWQKYEQENSLRLPARTVDDVEEDDPYNVVLFSDIAPFLLHFQPSSHKVLIDALLAFCNQPTIWRSRRSDWDEDAFVRNDTLDDHTHSSATAFEQQVDVLHENEELAAKPEKSHFLLSGIKNVNISQDSLFAPTESFLSGFQGSATSWSAVELDWLSLILQALVNLAIGGNELAEYFLAAELRFFPERASKSAKALLKKQPSNLRLYNAYALIEYRLGRSEVAKTALEKVISMSKSDPDIILLRRTLAWDALDRQNTGETLKHLLDGTEILQRQATLLKARDKALDAGSETQALATIECLLLISYLSSGASLEAAFAVFNSNASFLASRLVPESQSHAVLHQCLARFLYHHMSYGAFKPSQIRDILKQSIAMFPTNTAFLSLYAYNESRFKVYDRVRSVAQGIISNASKSKSSNDSMEHLPLIPHAFAIYTELSRSIVLGSNKHSIRSAFEDALVDSTTKHNISLWMRYLEFEVSIFRADRSGSSDDDAQRICDVFYRAINACPWAKSIYLHAFRHLRNLLKPLELRSIYDLMIERELRIRVPLTNS